MNGRFVIFLIFIFSFSFLWADEIHLKEGKILSGTITHESDEDYTIRLGKGMVLRVPKENAVKVVRTDSVAPPAANTYLTRPRPVETSTAVSSRPALSNLKAEATTKEHTLHGYKIVEVTLIKPYVVSGATLSDIRRDITDRDTGKGIKVDRKREASYGQWQVSNQKDTKVIVSTLTVLMPQWKPSGTPSSATIGEWNMYLASLSAFEEGRAKIYTEELNGFAESAARAPSDSEIKDLFEAMKTRAANRVQGYVRRSQYKK